MERFCERYGWTPDEFLNVDMDLIGTFSVIVGIDSYKEKLDQRRNERQASKHNHKAHR